MSTPNGPDNLRIGDAERVAAATALGDHFAAGRLDQAELDDRLTRVYAARVFADLDPLFVDLPGPHPQRPRVELPRADLPGGVTPLAACDEVPTWSNWQPFQRARGGLFRAGRPLPLRILTAVATLLGVMLIVGVLMSLLVPLLIIAAVVTLAGGRVHGRRRFQRFQPPIGRPAWGGDNAAWYQFGWSGRDWSHLSGSCGRHPGGRVNGPNRQHHRRRRG